ncbi:hypothetical protein CHS0354_040106 [Potamilus streckersoni]|uniref:Pseudouridine synthase I TruA alpha/beta domain-containing protein n=1 Tax=Potamilus streckersoni TaxID=2493646 RepID=A0AAE0SAY3_9BIVA|nr:hypothetical protein CHS0354_040106 [Potamilus streckersoni]
MRRKTEKQADMNGAVDDKPQLPPWKGVMVPCAELKSYLDSLPTFDRKNMLRKGREVHKIYVDMVKGETFLDDQFSYTEFGKMVLQNGSVRAGRAKNAKQIVVARETLYCSGTGACKRVCGGYGECIPGCDKSKMRGHRCSYRIKLTMRLGFVNYWFVEVLGDHDQIQSLDTSNSISLIETNSPPSSQELPLELQKDRDIAMDLSEHTLKLVPILPKTMNRSSSQLPDSTAVAHAAAGNLPNTVPDEIEDMPNEMMRYHYTLGLPSTLPETLPNSCSDTQTTSSLMSYIYKDTLSNSRIPLVIPTMPSEKNNSAINQTVNFSPMMVRIKQEPVDTQDQYPGEMIIPRPNLDSSSPISISTQGNSSQTSGKPMERAKIRKRAKTMHIPQKTLEPKNISNAVESIENVLNYSQQDFANLQNSSQNESHVGEDVTKCSLTVTSLSSPWTLSGSRVLQTPLLMNQLSQKIVENDSSGLRAIRENGWRINYEQVLTPPPTHLDWRERQKKQGMDVNGHAEDLSCKNKSHTNGDGDSLENGKDLIKRVQQLEAHVKQLQSIVIKKDQEESSESHTVKTGKKAKPQRLFDFSKYNTRHVALKIVYLGWDYHGYAVQEDTEKTIETALFDALLRTRLIESRETSNYHRCGRTDKGVSAFGQVISIDLRTNLLEGTGVKVREGGTVRDRPGEKTTEIRYVHILNRVLPPEIRILAWAPIDPNFSARFSCKKRTYKYFFPKGNLNVEQMNVAAQKLIGEHDYRNLCKMDVNNGVVNYTRKIMSADIIFLDERKNGYQMCELTVVGQAFLWHQIRCIVSILFLIGQSKEKPEIIDELLDVDKHARKPQYTMASEIPLVLFDADFGDDMEWIYEAEWHEDNIRHLQEQWAQHIIRATMIKRMLEELDYTKVETESDIAPWADLSAPIENQSEWLVPGNKPRVYKPLMQRPTCDSLEDRLESLAKRRKISNHEAEIDKGVE